MKEGKKSPVYDLCGLTVAGLGSPLIGALLGEEIKLDL
jgi:hypothetical protein